MSNMNRRGFMKMLAGVTAAIGLTGKAEEPKYEAGYDPGAKEGSILDPSVFMGKAVGIAITDIPKDHYGWVRIGQHKSIDGKRTKHKKILRLV